MIPKGNFIVLYGSLLVLFICLSEKIAYAGSSKTNILCSIDKPLATVGETIGIRAWPTNSNTTVLRYQWNAEGGRITSSGSEAKWKLAGMRPGTYHVSVYVTSATLENVGNCKVKIFVEYPALDLRNAGRETGRSFLAPEQNEALGYGLYSYLLFGTLPDNSNRDKYLSSIKAFLRFPSIESLEKYITNRRDLNITYIPIQKRLDPVILFKLRKRDYDDVANWLLENYDFARARSLLRNLPGIQREGPYIVSFTRPVSMGNVEPPYLLQDQTTVPPHLVSLWMNEFLNQVSQEHFWKERGGRSFALKLRNLIGILSIGVPKVKQALEDLISWRIE